MNHKQTWAVGLLAVALTGTSVEAAPLFSLKELPSHQNDGILVAATCGTSGGQVPNSRGYSGSSVRGNKTGSYIQGGMMLFNLGRQLLQSKKKKIGPEGAVQYPVQLLVPTSTDTQQTVTGTMTSQNDTTSQMLKELIENNETVEDVPESEENTTRVEDTTTVEEDTTTKSDDTDKKPDNPETTTDKPYDWRNGNSVMYAEPQPFTTGTLTSKVETQCKYVFVKNGDVPQPIEYLGL